MSQTADLLFGALTQFNHQFPLRPQNFLGFRKQLFVNLLTRFCGIDRLAGFMFVYGGVNPVSFLMAHIRRVGDDQMILAESVSHWMQCLTISEFKAVQAAVLFSILAGHF